MYNIMIVTRLITFLIDNGWEDARGSVLGHLLILYFELWACVFIHLKIIKMYI